MSKSGNQGAFGQSGPGYVRVDKWGSNVDIDQTDATAGQVIWPIKATVQQYLFIDSPIQLFLNSTSANDTAAGTGAREVSGQFHNSSGIVIDFTLATNGASNVAIPDTSYGVFRFSVSSSGNLNKNDGDLRIVDGVGNIYAIIKAGEGQTQISVLRCPDDKKGTVTVHTVGYGRTGGNQSAQMRFVIRKQDGTEIIKDDPFISVDLPKTEDEFEIKFEAGEWVFWKCISTSADNTPIKASFRAKFEDA